MPSAASTSAFLDNLYQSKFGRAPDAGGKAYWTKQINSGKITTDQVAKSFDASQEAKDRAANNIAVGVKDTSSFQKAKAANEAKASASTSAASSTPAATVTTTSNTSSANSGGGSTSIPPSESGSNENVTITASSSSGGGGSSSGGGGSSTPSTREQVEGLYKEILHRGSDEGGSDYWTEEIESGRQTIDQVRGHIAASAEAKKVSDNLNFLENLYKTDLDRTESPDADVTDSVLDTGGKEYWMKELATGSSQDDVARAVRHSNEFEDAATEWIKGTYSDVLGREYGYKGEVNDSGDGDHRMDDEAGEISGMDYWLNHLRSGDSREDVRNMIANTDEGWIESMYREHLDRSAGAEGRTYWGDDLKGGATREEVLANIKRSAEYQCKSSGGAWDGASRTCGTQPTPCPEGQTRDSAGNCQPNQTPCPTGQVRDSSGACVPEQTPCPTGQTRNAAGVCEVDEVTCPTGQTKDANGNCINTPIVCGTGQKLNAAGTGCVPDTTECPTGQTRNAAGQCVPENTDPTECPAGQTRNAAGQCTTTNPNTDCPAGKARNSAGVCVDIDTDPGGDNTDTNNPVTTRPDGSWMGPNEDADAGDDPSGAYSNKNPTQSYDNKKAEYAQLYAHTLQDKANLEGETYKQLQRELQGYIDAQRDDETSRLRSGITIGGNQASQRPSNLKSGSPSYGKKSSDAGLITSGPKYKDDRPYAPRGVRKGNPINSSYFAMAERF